MWGKGTLFLPHYQTFSAKTVGFISQNLQGQRLQVPDEIVRMGNIHLRGHVQGKGIGSEMIREAIRLAKTCGMKAIRLDALASNTPAHKIYKTLGFEYRGKQHLYAENTGWTDFCFFEYNDLC